MYHLLSRQEISRTVQLVWVGDFMNFHKYFKSSALIDNPLCGITAGNDDYKDELNLSTDACIRYIKRRIFDGAENWEVRQEGTDNAFFMLQTSDVAINHLIKASHFSQNNIGTTNTNTGVDVTTQGHVRFRPINVSSMNISDFKSFLSQQYTSGTPVIVWYVLAEPTTETITVPSGLSGTVEGYLIQDGTPTPTSPIYPIANNAVGWYDITNYVRDTTWQARGSIYNRSGGSWSSSAKKRSRLKKK